MLPTLPVKTKASIYGINYAMWDNMLLTTARTSMEHSFLDTPSTLRYFC